MSDPNGPSPFQPPQFQPPAPPQPTVPMPVYGAGPDGPPTAPVEVAQQPPSKKGRSKGLIIGAAVAVVALVGAGAFALVKITGDDAKGGAASPIEAGEQLVTALNDEDILGVVDLLLPGERETFRQPMIDLVDNLKRLKVLGEGADASKVAGIDIDLQNPKVTEKTSVADDITNISITATDESTVDGKALPIGDIVLNEALDGKQPTDEVEPSGQPLDVSMTTVEKDGRWYLSLWYSVAETARQAAGDDLGVPATGVDLVGAAEPEGAVDQMIQAATKLDVAAMIGGLNPNEAEALQRYAPLFVDDVDQVADDAGVQVTFSDATYEVTGSGNRRHVEITGFKLGINAEDQEASIELKDGCTSITVPDNDPVKVCAADAGDLTKIFEDAGIDQSDVDPSITKAITTVQDAFAGYQAPGIAVEQVDGKWYVSPIATGIDAINGALGALDSSELQDIIDAFKDLQTSVGVPTLPNITGDNPFDTGIAAEDFRDQTASFITGDEIAQESGLTFVDAECETPASTDVGTGYTCTGWTDAGDKYTFDVAITGDGTFEVRSYEPA